LKRKHSKLGEEESKKWIEEQLKLLKESNTDIKNQENKGKKQENIQLKDEIINEEFETTSQNEEMITITKNSMLLENHGTAMNDTPLNDDISDKLLLDMPSLFKLGDEVTAEMDIDVSKREESKILLF